MENPLGDMTREQIMAALKTLMDKGLVEMSWCEEQNDFTFYNTKEGHRVNDEEDWEGLEG